MSLLIKALANAEKEKLAELDKANSKGHADSTIAFELAPIESAADASVDSVENAIQEPIASSYADVSAVLLSLEEEAGLSPQVEPQSAKAKSAPQPKAKAKSATHLNAADLNPSHATLNYGASATLAKAESAQQKVAAKAFVANQPIKGGTSKSALIALGVAGALLIWFGLQGYQYLQDLTAPEVVMVRQPLPAAVIEPVAATSPEVDSASVAVDAAVDGAVVENANQVAHDAQKSAVSESVKEPMQVVAYAEVEPAAGVNKAPVSTKREKVVKALEQQSSTDAIDEEEALPPKVVSKRAEKKEPLKLVSRTPEAGVDPTLLAAYQAYSGGDDAVAQQKYRQVLQRDVRNVDALLGMAAIAQRQGRGADAAGWYQKVLEIEPRNSVAQSGMVASQTNADMVGTESRIKNMLVQQPEAASLHAALGNLYAEQNQWAQAQEAYFNASRFAPNSADYAFNLAISMEHLGKPGLALTQYQRALELLNSSGAASPDRAQVEDRIRALR